MSWQRALEITELERDRSSRVARISFGSKSMRTPSFCSWIQTPMDFDMLMHLKTLRSVENIGSFIIRLFDASDILPSRKKYFQTDMFGRVITDRVSLYLENNIFAIDPATEYLFYDSKMQRFQLDSLASRPIREYVVNLQKYKNETDDSHEYNNVKSRLHKTFWESVASEAAVRNKLVRDVFQCANLFGADFLIPPVPLALDERLLEIAGQVNEVSREIALALGRKECASYFILPRSALRSAKFLERVKRSVLDSPARLCILKFKYLDLTGPRMMTERENYKDLLLDLAYLSKTFKHRAFMVLESGYQTFASAVVGFDIVSSSVTGFDGDGGFSEHPAYGSWLDPKLMVHANFDEVRRIFHNNGARLPCHHDMCKALTDLDLIKPEEWNLLRRQHSVLYHNDLMREITRAIVERNIEFARERLINSQLSALKGLVPVPS